MTRFRLTALLCGALWLTACSEPDIVPCDGGRVDRSGERPRCVYPDASRDGEDAAVRDSGPPRDAGSEGGRPDGSPDAGALDAGALDAGALDAGALDAAAFADAGGAAVGDAPNCLDDFDCPFSSDHVLDLSAAAEATYDGQIDGSSHDIPTRSCGTVTSADRDVIRIRAPVRSIFEIVVEPDAGGLLEPILETYDEAARFILTYAEGTDRARTMLISPAPPPEAVAVMVHHAAAYGSLCSAPSAFRGGEGYGYRLTARRCDACAIEELGALQTTRKSASTELAAPGALAVFRFTAPVDAEPSVTVSLEGSCPAPLEDACWPVVVPLRPGGETDSLRRAHYTDTSRSFATTDTQTFPPTNGAGERLFAVYDYAGRGASGYRVAITVSP